MRKHRREADAQCASKRMAPGPSPDQLHDRTVSGAVTTGGSTNEAYVCASCRNRSSSFPPGPGNNVLAGSGCSLPGTQGDAEAVRRTGAEPRTGDRLIVRAAWLQVAGEIQAQGLELREVAEPREGTTIAQGVRAKASLNGGGGGVSVVE